MVSIAILGLNNMWFCYVSVDEANSKKKKKLAVDAYLPPNNLFEGLKTVSGKESNGKTGKIIIITCLLHPLESFCILH